MTFALTTGTVRQGPLILQNFVTYQTGLLITISKVINLITIGLTNIVPFKGSQIGLGQSDCSRIARVIQPLFDM